MSFIFDGYSTEALGHTATLRRLPSFQGLQLETLEAPGTDGKFLGGATRSEAAYVFDTIIHGTSVADAHSKRDALALALDPDRGERWLSFDAAPGWRWLAIPSGVIDWERLTWDAGAGFQLRADITFAALQAYGRLVDDEQWSWASPGSRTVARSQGNARSYPTVEIEGTLTAGQSVTVTIGGVTVTVPGPLTSGQTLRLDYDTFEFARWSGATKLASVVRGMTSLDRAELWPNTTTTFNVATTGTVTGVTLLSNARRQ